MRDESNELKCVLVDYTREQDTRDLVRLLDVYAQDPMGTGKPLSRGVRERLIDGLRSTPGAFSMLVRVQENDKEIAIGLANCFPGFSTFKARKLVNIHDIVVHPDWRGKGVGGMLLDAVEREARSRDMCKMTLEVRTDNPAENLYRRSGFGDGDQAMRFLTKELE